MIKPTHKVTATSACKTYPHALQCISEVEANQYAARNTFATVTPCGKWPKAFGDLRMHPGEPLELAVRRGLACVVIVALFNLNHLG